jgi:RNA 3'-terminal phosphate cyclase (ATP)
MIRIDGAAGEGGGQVLRTALGLSLVTGRPFQIDAIRAGRARPGLLRQHLACVRAAQAIGSATVEGDSLGSRALTFRPGRLVPGDHTIDVGSAGSALLVLQAVLPALLVAPAPIRLTIGGGTHNPAAPPWDFIAAAFLPRLRRMGARIDARLVRHGFYPAGGGRVVIDVSPAPLTPLVEAERGPVLARRGRAILSGIGDKVGHRELRVLHERLGIEWSALKVEEVPHPVGPGNALVLEVESQGGTEVFTAFGERGRTAEVVAAGLAEEVSAWDRTGVPVGPHLADQLLLPVALAGGRFRTAAPTLHTLTNIDVIQAFFPGRFVVERGDAVEIRSTGRWGEGFPVVA